MNNDSNLIKHQFNREWISQRPVDGYISLNQMAKANKKLIRNWLRLEETQELLAEFNSQQQALNENLHISDLRYVDSQQEGANDNLNSEDPRYLEPIITSKARRDRGGGTWAHPDIAIAFAMWCSPAFHLVVCRWVRLWMTGQMQNTSSIDEVLEGEALVPPRDYEKRAVVQAMQEFGGIERGLVVDAASSYLASTIRSKIEAALPSQKTGKGLSREGLIYSSCLSDITHDIARPRVESVLAWMIEHGNLAQDDKAIRASE